MWAGMYLHDRMMTCTVYTVDSMRTGEVRWLSVRYDGVHYM